MAVYEKWPTIKYGPFTVGKDDVGHDVKFFGATSGKYFLWDESEDTLVLTGDVTLVGDVEHTGTQTWSGLLTANGGLTVVGTLTLPARSIETADLALVAVDTPQLADNAVKTAKIYALQVTTAKIAEQAITESKIGLTAVDTPQLKDNAVKTAKIYDNQVTTAKLVNGAVTNAKIGLTAVDTPQLADNSVKTAKIYDLQVTTAKIVDQAVTEAKIGLTAVDTPQLKDNAVKTGKIYDSQVTSAKIATLTGLLTTTSTTGFRSNPTFVPDATYTNYALAVGWEGDANELLVTFAESNNQNMDMLQFNINVDSAGAPGTGPTNSSQMNLIHGYVTHDTDQMAYLRLKGIDMTLYSKKNCKALYAIQGEIELADTQTVTDEATVLGLVLNASAGTITAPTRGIVIAMNGNSMPTTNSMGILIATGSGCDLYDGIYIETQGGTSIHNSIRLGSANGTTITNGIDIGGSGTFTVGIDIGSNCTTGISSAAPIVSTYAGTALTATLADGGGATAIPMIDLNWTTDTTEGDAGDPIIGTYGALGMEGCIQIGDQTTACEISNAGAHCGIFNHINLTGSDAELDEKADVVANIYNIMNVKTTPQTDEGTICCETNYLRVSDSQVHSGCSWYVSRNAMYIGTNDEVYSISAGHYALHDDANTHAAEVAYAVMELTLDVLTGKTNDGDIDVLRMTNNGTQKADSGIFFEGNGFTHAFRFGVQTDGANGVACAGYPANIGTYDSGYDETPGGYIAVEVNGSTKYIYLHDNIVVFS